MTVFFLEGSLDRHQGLPGLLAMVRTQLVPAETGDLEQARQLAHARIGAAADASGPSA